MTFDMQFEEWWYKNDYDLHYGKNIKKITQSAWNAAPAAKLKPLTDDEITEAVNSAPFKDMVTADDYVFLIARAVEKAILEKSK